LPLECGEQADVAQLVEQLIRNQQVNGSSPFVGSSIFNNLAGSCYCATVQALYKRFFSSKNTHRLLRHCMAQF
jgi:hypothetical protein